MRIGVARHAGWLSKKLKLKLWGSTDELLRSLGKRDHFPGFTDSSKYLENGTISKLGSSSSNELDIGNMKLGHGVWWIDFSKSQSTKGGTHLTA